MFMNRRGEPFQTYETNLPWIIYTYLRSDLQSIFLGSKIHMRCAYCGKNSKTLWISQPKIWFPRFFNSNDSYHRARKTFVEAHTHRNEPTYSILSWAHNRVLNVSGASARDGQLETAH